MKILFENVGPKKYRWETTIDDFHPAALLLSVMQNGALDTDVIGFPFNDHTRKSGKIYAYGVTCVGEWTIK